MRIAVVANSAWYIANFRLRLMAALRDMGHDVIAVSPEDADVVRITESGFAHHSFALTGSGTRPLQELRSLWLLREVLVRERIELVLSYTPKCNIYSSFARLGLRCKQVANVSGLGSSFIRQDWLTHLVRWLYWLSFRSVDWVFFQNEDDRQTFLQRRIVPIRITERIPGSGVDLQRFAMAPMPSSSAVIGPVFLMIARVLEDKGVREYATASARLRTIYPGARFQLLGRLGVDNPSAITAQEFHNWTDSGSIDYLGYHSDVRPFISAASCIVLPSYREGMPRSLLEAGAMGRPLIATEVPGCRDTIDDGRNGFLCRARDSASLAAALERFIRMSPEQQAQMGQLSRQKMEEHFSEDRVIESYQRLVDRMAR
jgi:glycosyltransferase involved in cell wall biosynthesis